MSTPPGSGYALDIGATGRVRAGYPGNGGGAGGYEGALDASGMTRSAVAPPPVLIVSSPSNASESSRTRLQPVQTQPTARSRRRRPSHSWSQSRRTCPSQLGSERPT
jgi:hypothetical protein